MLPVLQELLQPLPLPRAPANLSAVAVVFSMIVLMVVVVMVVVVGVVLVVVMVVVVIIVVVMVVVVGRPLLGPHPLGGRHPGHLGPVRRHPGPRPARWLLRWSRWPGPIYTPRRSQPQPLPPAETTA